VKPHGFPSDSPQADAPAFDDIIQAACGVPDVLRRATGRSGLMPTLLADKVSGLVLAYAITAALFHRARTGEGQRVEVPMADAMLAFLLVEHGGGAIPRPTRGPAGYQRILTPLRGALPEDEHPDAGRYKVIPPPVRFSATPASVRRPAPLAGQHTREVLAEAGLAEEEITRLAEAGVLTGDRAGPGTRAPAG
jgi:crotonobetainyl-CoA:carnitine CoA-transferase CaiB-like acyl-CoA transferase